MASAVEITKPDQQVIRLGPFDDEDGAARVAVRLRAAVAGSAPEGTTVEVIDYDAALPHGHLDVPTDVEGLALAMQAMPAGDGTGRAFPDLYDRLWAQEGKVLANRLWWAAMCRAMDA
jgi:hypothetical protein